MAEMKSVVTARWERSTEAGAMILGTHLLDFVNEGLVELTVTHTAIDPAKKADDDA